MSDKAFSLEQVLRWAAKTTGLSVRTQREDLIDIIRASLEALTNEESVDTIRKWCIFSSGCYLTLPKELQDPTKYKLCGKSGPVRSRLYEFMGYVREDDVEGFSSDLRYVGTFPTFFELPSQGGRVAARSLEMFAGGDPPYIVVQGEDMLGNVVYTPTPDGNVDIGERIYISQPNKAPIYSNTKFKRITSVRIVNAEINIQFIWCNVAAEGQAPHEMGLLSYYDAGEEYPTFRRYKLPVTGEDSYRVEILGHLKQPSLRYDNELIRGFDSGVIQDMIRANYYKSKNDLDGARFNSSLAVSSIRKRNEKLIPNSDLIDVDVETCAGSFKVVF